MRSLTVDLPVALPAALLVTLLGASLAASCSSTKPSMPEGWGVVGTTRGYHDGPEIVFGPTGTSRYAGPLLEAYDEQAAMATSSSISMIAMTSELSKQKKNWCSLPPNASIAARPAASRSCGLSTMALIASVV